MRSIGVSKDGGRRPPMPPSHKGRGNASPCHRHALAQLNPEKSPMGNRRWLDVLKDAWDSCMSKFGWLERHPESAWLRRDIGLAEDDMKSRSDRIDEIRQKHSGWV